MRTCYDQVTKFFFPRMSDISYTTINTYFLACFSENSWKIV